MVRLSFQEQLDLLQNRDFDNLIAYAKVRNLNPRVVVSLLSQMKEMHEKQSREAASIH